MLGDMIKEARKAKKLTQKQLADMIGAKHSSISDWENNLHRPSINLIPEIGEVLGVKVSWLLEEDEQKPDDTNVTNFLTNKIEKLSDEDKEEIDKYIEYLISKHKK